MPEVALASLDPRLQKLMDNARIALERGNYDYVIEACSQVLRAEPRCLGARKLQRAAQLRQFKTRSRLVAKARGSMTKAGFMLGGTRKDPARGLEMAEKILATDPTSVAGLRLLGESAAALDMPETAAFGYEALREYEPDNKDVLLHLGEALLAAGKVTESLKAADEVLKRDSTDARALDLMRKASIAQATAHGNWEGQGNYREKLRDEQHAIGLEQSAKLMTAEEMQERLIEEIMKRIAAEPENLTHYRDLVQHYRQGHDLESALAWVRKVRELPVAQNDAGFEKLEMEIQTVILEEELRRAERSLHALPGDRALQGAVESTRQKLAEYQMEEFKSLVERYPNDAQARFRLGELYFQSGQVDAAIAQFQHAQKSPSLHVAALRWLGVGFKSKKLYDLAVTQLLIAKSETVEMNDTRKDILYLLGECFEAMGKSEEAIAEFKAIYAEDIGFRDVTEKINRYYSLR